MVLFGDFLSPLEEIQAAVGRLSAIPVSGYLLQVLDPAEADLPYSGRIRFRGLEREGDTLIPRVEGVRDEYARAAEGAAGGAWRRSAPPPASALPSTAPTIHPRPRCWGSTRRWPRDDGRNKSGHDG